ncbi:MAG: hypothetical protein KAJ81_05990, partial [Candidatus Latescibacteria bacterium]|nr:hypothetical protein [Candidatus Latescibacterota bacterium]
HHFHDLSCVIGVGWHGKAPPGESEVRGQRPEARGQRPEARGQKPEARIQESGVRRRKFFQQVHYSEF